MSKFKRGNRDYDNGNIINEGMPSVEASEKGFEAGIINEEEMENTDKDVASAQTVKPKKKKRGKLLIIVIIIFALLVVYRIGTNFFGADGEEKVTAVNVKTATAQMGEIYVESPISGTIKAVDEESVIPIMAGKVKSVNVKEGDYVRKGAVLITIDDQALQTSIFNAREAYENAKTTYGRMETLYNEGVISQQDFEASRYQYVTAEETYRSVQDSADNYVVTAPISGYLTTFNAIVGSPVGQSPIGTITDTSQLVIETTVTESMATKINQGDTVDVYVSSLDKVFSGKVTTFNKIPAQGMVTYPVTISLSDPQKELLAGMFAEIRIKSEYSKSALLIPSGAVMIKDGESQVVTLTADNKPLFNIVVTGIDNGESVEIVSGIKAGDTVVVSGQQYVKADQTVNIAN